MDNLIMRQYENVIFAVRITHGKCHHMMIVFSEIRIQLHIFRKIVHPPHIPLKAKSKTSVFYISGYLRPCRRLFRYHKCPRISSKYNCVQMLEEIYCLQVLITSILVRNPFSVFLSIIQVQHRSNCINSKSINMEMLHPEKCIGNQEVPYLILAKIKYLRPPVRMLPFSWICILVSCCSVKLGKSMLVLWKMCRNPVHNDTDSISMQIIDHPRKIFRCSITACRRIISCHLISP